MRLRLETDVVELLFLLFAAVVFDEGNHIDEIGVVGVDVTQLDLDQVFYHLLGFVQGFQEEGLHYLEDLLGQVLVALDLGDFYSVDHTT